MCVISLSPRIAFRRRIVSRGEPRLRGVGTDEHPAEGSPRRSLRWIVLAVVAAIVIAVIAFVVVHAPHPEPK